MFIMDAIIRFFNGPPFFSLSAVHRTVWTLEGSSDWLYCTNNGVGPDILHTY